MTINDEKLCHVKNTECCSRHPTPLKDKSGRNYVYVRPYGLRTRMGGTYVYTEI